MTDTLSKSGGEDDKDSTDEIGIEGLTLCLLCAEMPLLTFFRDTCSSAYICSLQHHHTQESPWAAAALPPFMTLAPRHATPNAPTRPQLQLVPGYTTLVWDKQISPPPFPWSPHLLRPTPKSGSLSSPSPPSWNTGWTRIERRSPWQCGKRSRCIRGEPCAFPGVPGQDSGPIPGKGERHVTHLMESLL